MLKPITCPNCKRAVGWYETATWSLVKPEMLGVMVIVAIIDCKCGHRCKFNGTELWRRQKRERQARQKAGAADRREGKALKLAA